MGKKHSKIKTREVKVKDAPQHIKDMLGEQDSATTKDISGKTRDFVQMQKDYNSVSWGVVVLRAELEAMMTQLQLSFEKRSIKWNGMVMPDQVLRAHTGLKNLKYIEGIQQKESIKKNLIAQGLTVEQVRIAGEDGKYVTELPVMINLGKAAPGVNKG